MEISKLESLFETTAVNFNFKIGNGFKPLFGIIAAQTEKVTDQEISKKFQQLWLLTNEEWHKSFNLQWGGYPSLAQWLEILVEKPLTDEEIEKRKLEFERDLTIQASIVGTWVNAPYYERLFCERYKNPLYSHIKSMIDTYFNLNENLTDDRIKKMAVCLKERLEADKTLFYKTLKGIARNQQQLLT